MKLIIDIDEEKYRQIKTMHNAYGSEICNAIKNGTPVSTEGDLISREALKAIIIEPLNVNDACKNDFYEGYYTAKNEDIMAIDNATTVSNEYDEGFNAGYAEAIKNIPEYRKLADKLQRPQGEWIKIGELGLAYKCNKCGEVDVVSTNFCPNCGADMRGDKE